MHYGYRELVKYDVVRDLTGSQKSWERKWVAGFIARGDAEKFAKDLSEINPKHYIIVQQHGRVASAYLNGRGVSLL